MELQLEPLQQNRMVDVAFGAAPTQDAVTQNKLDTLRLTVDAPIQSVQSFKDFHGGTSGLFVFRPLVARELPALQGRGPCLVIIEIHDAWIACCIRFLSSLAYEDVFGRVFPPLLKPGNKSIRRLGRSSKRWALDLYNESLAIVSYGLALLGLGS